MADEFQLDPRKLRSELLRDWALGVGGFVAFSLILKYVVGSESGLVMFWNHLRGDSWGILVIIFILGAWMPLVSPRYAGIPTRVSFHDDRISCLLGRDEIVFRPDAILRLRITRVGPEVQQLQLKAHLTSLNVTVRLGGFDSLDELSSRLLASTSASKGVEVRTRIKEQQYSSRTTWWLTRCFYAFVLVPLLLHAFLICLDTIFETLS